MSVAPTRFLSFGGRVTVKVFQNRETTHDIDVLIDPHIEAVDEFRQEIPRVASDVAGEGSFVDDWFNDELRLFIGQGKRTDLFFESIGQGMVAYEGENLIIYVGSLEFSLERKLHRISSERQRDRRNDLSDAVAIVHAMKNDHPLSKQYVKNLDRNGFGVLMDDYGIEEVASAYVRRYQCQGLVDMIWDNEHRCYKYADLQRQWVYVPG